MKMYQNVIDSIYSRFYKYMKLTLAAIVGCFTHELRVEVMIRGRILSFYSQNT